MSGTDPQSVASVLGVATRIAQRMGLHSESAHAKCTPFEAEMRRRLWWSLVLFDARVCELAGNSSSGMLVPTWDCATPLNVNDFDLQPDMKNPPTMQGRSTEALFAVVRSEIGDSLRHSDFHLDFTNPLLKKIAKDVQRDSAPKIIELFALEKTIEEKYLRYCNPENPLHFITVWTARYHLARNRLVESYSRSPSPSIQQADAQRDDAVSCSLNMLECDTNLITSPHTKGYLWLPEVWFPFPAYIRLVQDLKKRPTSELADRIWDVLSKNYKAHFEHLRQSESPFLKVFAHVVLRAWEAREALPSHVEESPTPPWIVSDIRRKLTQSKQDTLKSPDAKAEQFGEVLGMSVDSYSTPMPVNLSDDGMLFGMETQSYQELGIGHRQAALDVNISQLGWNSMGWNSFQDLRW